MPVGGTVQQIIHAEDTGSAGRFQLAFAALAGVNVAGDDGLGISQNRARIVGKNKGAFGTGGLDHSR